MTVRELWAQSPPEEGNCYAVLWNPTTARYSLMDGMALQCHSLMDKYAEAQVVIGWVSIIEALVKIEDLEARQVLEYHA